PTSVSPRERATKPPRPDVSRSNSRGSSLMRPSPKAPTTMRNLRRVPMAELPLLTIHTDGAARGNPGPAAYAYVIAREGQPPVEEAGLLGETTNNQAEYIALVKALAHALDLGAQHRVVVHSDSELMVKQLNGEYRVKNEELR